MKKYPIENLFNKAGLRSTPFRKLRDYSLQPPNILWSRGWFAHCDYCGDLSFCNPAYPTRYMVKSLHRLRGKRGVIWLRLGSYPINESWGRDRLGDVATFARDVIGHLSGPTVLVTTDGDMSIPDHLPAGVAQQILSDPNIMAWYTQHYDGTLRHPKLLPLPVGLGLHAGVMNRLTGIHGQAKKFFSALGLSLPQNERLMRVWSDVHFRVHQHNGASRAPLAEAIRNGELKALVDAPVRRLPQTEIWRQYGRYAFVVSLPGHGWESYRTWEALALGAIVLTVHSPIDILIKDYRVVFIDSSKNDWWLILRDPNWLETACLQASRKPVVDLSWHNWVNKVRSHL